MVHTSFHRGSDPCGLLKLICLPLQISLQTNHQQAYPTGMNEMAVSKGWRGSQGSSTLLVLTQGSTVVLGLASSCGLGASPRQRECDIGEIPVLIWGPSLVTVSVTSTLNKTPSSAHNALSLICTAHPHARSYCGGCSSAHLLVQMPPCDAWWSSHYVFSFSSRRLEPLPLSLDLAPYPQCPIRSWEGGQAVGL